MQLMSFQKNFFNEELFQRFILILLGIFIFLYLFDPIETEDIWWHLATGRWIVEHLQVPKVDIFPFANETVPWSCHNQWLGSTLLYLINKFFGLLGLKLFRPLFFLYIIGVIFKISRKNLPFVFSILLMLLVALGISSRSYLKPDIFNIVFIPLVLINLFKYQETNQRKYLLLLPFIMCIWFNIHLGALVYGVSLIVIFMLSEFIEYLILRIKKINLSEIINSKHRIVDLSIILLASVLSFIINPYGLEGFLYPFKVFLIPDYLGFFRFAPSIKEMLPPLYIFKSFNYFYYFLIFIMCLIALLINKRRKFIMIIILLFATVAFIKVARNSAFFTLLCAILIVISSSQAKLNDIWKRFSFRKIIECFLFLGIIIFLCFQIANIWNSKYYLNSQYIDYRFIQEEPNTTEAIKLLIKNNIKGPIYNTDGLGGKMIWMGYPDLRPFRDGRNHSYERSYNSLVLLYHLERNWTIAESRYGFKIVSLYSSGSLYLNVLKFLKIQPSWQIIAINGSIVTFVKRGEFNLSQELNNFEEDLNLHQTISKEDMEFLKETILKKNFSIFNRFSTVKPSNIDLFLSYKAKYKLGYEGAAVKDLIKVLKISDHPEVYKEVEIILNKSEKSK